MRTRRKKTSIIHLKKNKADQLFKWFDRSVKKVSYEVKKEEGRRINNLISALNEDLESHYEGMDKRERFEEAEEMATELKSYTDDFVLYTVYLYVKPKDMTEESLQEDAFEAFVEHESTYSDFERNVTKLDVLSKFLDRKEIERLTGVNEERNKGGWNMDWNMGLHIFIEDFVLKAKRYKKERRS